MIFIIFLSFFSQILFANDLKENLTYLSSDLLKGRQSATTGNEQALSFLEQQLVTNQIAPLGDDFRQEFTIFSKMTENGPNFLSSNLVEEERFRPISFSASGDLKNLPIVFVGYGISVPPNNDGIEYDDYKNIDVKGKIVVFLTGDPAIGNPASPFRNPHYLSYRSLYYKLKNALIHEAKGAIIIRDPISLENYPNEPSPQFHANDGGGERLQLLAGRATNKWLNQHLTKIDTLSLQRLISKTGIPQSFQISQWTTDLSVHLKKETARVANLVAFIEGHSPQLKREIIVLGAHMDHLGLGGQSSLDPSPLPKIHNGADDNASGTALILELAKDLKKRGTKRSIAICFFNAEEAGLIGSAHFVSSWPSFQEERGEIVAMLNFDMVGRFQEKALIMGLGSAIEWQELFANLDENNFLPFKTQNSTLYSSDHASFLKDKIPALFFTTGTHEDYHKSSDDSEKINFPQLANLKNMALAVTQLVADGAKPIYDPNFERDNPGRGQSRGYGAFLGCVPEFGNNDQSDGVLCTRAVNGSPADNAGVRSGDILIQLGDIEIKSIYDLAFALKYYRASDQVLLAYRHEQVIIKKNITLLSRESNEKSVKDTGCHEPEVY